MKLSLLIPTHKPKFADNILNNIQRQYLPQGLILDVCIVINGEANDADFQDTGFTIRYSENDVVSARNTALTYAKETNLGGLFAFFDQDDLYGSLYLSEMVHCANKADVVGKHSVFYQLSDGKVVLLDRGRELEYVDGIHGPTMAGWVDRVPLFPPCNQWGEDIRWIKDILKNGGQIYSSSHFNFCGVRHVRAEHTWISADQDICRFAARRVFLFNSVEEAFSGASGQLVEDLSIFDASYT